MILRQLNSTFPPNSIDNVSPIFTDETDINLSDDDPSFDYEQLLNNEKKKNYFFEYLNCVSESDSDDSSSELHSANKDTNKIG